MRRVDAPTEAVRRIFGHRDFRPGQRAIVDDVLADRDVCELAMRSMSMHQ